MHDHILAIHDIGRHRIYLLSPMMRTLAGTLLALSFLLPVPASARPQTISVPDGRVRLAQRGERSVVSGTVGGRGFSLTLPPEEGIYAESLYDLKFVGGLPRAVLILRVDYLSRPRMPRGACGAGIETVLRVIALRPRPHETFRQRVASCWTDIEFGEIGWNDAASTLTVERNLLTDPAGNTRSSYRIDGDGVVTPGKVEPLP